MNRKWLPMKKHTIFKILISVLLLAMEVYPSRAQNLPRIQQNSLRVPLNTKIDGKLGIRGPGRMTKS